MATILETLENAEYNLKSAQPFQREIGLDQLHNAIVLLEKGYDVYVDVDLLVATHGSACAVPEVEGES